jgi:aldose sugar dehydrogenase
MKLLKLFLATMPLLFISMAGCSQPPPETFDSEMYKIRTITVTSDLKIPWGLAFLPDGRMIVTEKRGTMRLIENGKLIAKSIEGIPKATEHGQGGLLDVVLHPKYAENGWIYWTYNAEEKGLHGTELARGKLGGTKTEPRMTDVQVLFKQQPKSDREHHFGSRIVFDRAGYLYVGFGDRGDNPDKGYEERAQKINDLAGKTIRLFDDGRVPPDNPFINTPNARAEIFTLGNRNIQGAALHPVTGKIWMHEHGPQGGDEINIITAGTNYGWPVITYGANYGTGTKIGEGTEKSGMAQPLYKWVPSIAPSGMAFYSGKAMPKWKDNLFVGALAKQALVRLTLDGDKVISEERLFENKLGRIRDVREGPDGHIYVLTNGSDSKLLKLEIANQ